MLRDRITLGISLVILVVLLAIAQARGILVYNNNPPRIFMPREQVLAPNLSFHFKDNSALLGKEFLRQGKYNTWRIAKSVVVTDLDNDGWDDLIFLTSPNNSEAKELHAFHNNNGKSFKEISGPLLAAPSKLLASVSRIAVADLDNDGKPELILAHLQAECSAFKLREGKFESDPRWKCDGNPDRPISIAFTDANKDGFLDLFIGNMSRSVEVWGFNLSTKRNTNCGSASFFLNKKGEGFAPDSLHLENIGCAFGAAFSDFADLGLPDFFLATDYGISRFLMNKGGGSFEDKTRSVLGLSTSSNGMSTAMADLFGEGRSSIYEGNFPINPGLFRGFNRLLWNKSSNGKLSFEDISLETQTDTCGETWGARFIDPDRNAFPDILATNGNYRVSGESWYLRQNVESTVYPLRKLTYDPEKITFRMPGDGFQNCLFMNSGKVEPWENVALSAGIKDERHGFGVAVFDFNRDGQEDLIIMNADGSPILYEGEYEGKNHWLGIKLEGTRSNRDAIGARILVRSGNRLQSKEVYPWGDSFTQSSLLQVFGIPDGIDSAEVEILWPSGIHQKFHPAALDQYFTVREAE